MVIPEYDNNIFLSSRNLPKAAVSKIGDLNTYEILHTQNLLISESAVSNFVVK
jgi:large subunit ribosomal protein L4